jgi:hypothetical protein
MRGTTLTALQRARPSRWVSAVMLTVLATPAVALAAPKADVLTGTGISRIEPDTRRLTINAETGTADGPAEGHLSFAHQAPAGISRFKGDVSCLRVMGQTAEISGFVTEGLTASGVVLTGKQFAFTIELGNQQSFSLPRLGTPTMIKPCSGGRTDKVAVTQAGFKTR